MARFGSMDRESSGVAEEESAHDASMGADEATSAFGMSAADNAQEERPSALVRFGSIGLVIVALISSGTAYYFYRQTKTLKANPQKIAQEEVAAVVAQVGRLIVLPEGETPTVATVSDAERLKGQPFFSQAKNGDKVLIYTTARKAVLYSPEQDKIVEVAPLNLGGQ